jgi:imidazole glycerol-phosphate synthase subunit HisH
MLARSTYGGVYSEHKGSFVSIAIVDYGAGNLTSVKKAFDWLGQAATVTSDADAVHRAERVIVPGVGHFAATATIDRNGLRKAIESAIQRGTPVLGICLGMQWMFASSAEASGLKGLGIFSGECEHFPATVKSPHVGWNRLHWGRESKLFANVDEEPFVYFTHSYRAPIDKYTVASCEYGGEFSAAVERDNVFGVQFHPEKSGTAGIKLLEAFCNLPC